MIEPLQLDAGGRAAGGKSSDLAILLDARRRQFGLGAVSTRQGAIHLAAKFKAEAK